MWVYVICDADRSGSTSPKRQRKKTFLFSISKFYTFVCLFSQLFLLSLSFGRVARKKSSNNISAGVKTQHKVTQLNDPLIAPKFHLILI